MARDVLTAQTLPGFGAALAADISWDDGVSANGIAWEGTGKELLLIFNQDAGAQTVTVNGVANPINFNNAKNIAPSVGASEYQIIGPFEPAAFNQPSGTYVGKVTADFSVETIDFAVIRLP